jgi:hypothetical protein
MKKPPRYLYKYMNKSLDRIGDVLVNRRLYFADPARFNDPFDCALGLDFRRGATIQNWEDYFTHLVEMENRKSTLGCRRAKAKDNIRRGRHTDPAFLEEAEEKIRRDVKKVGREQGVLSLSSDPKNVMMWAHYAANHEGLVLRFDTRHMADQASGELRCFQVKYHLSIPQLPDYLAALRAFGNGDIQAFAKLFFCRKSRDWKYENEWRFFAGKPDTLVDFEPPMLSGVIFGWKMPESTRLMVAAWATALATPPKLLQAEPCPDRFRMKITKMTMGAQPSH